MKLRPHTSETSETYDPDSKVVRSTQTVESRTQRYQWRHGRQRRFRRQRAARCGSAGAPPRTATKSNSTRDRRDDNYEIIKTIKTSTSTAARSSACRSPSSSTAHRRYAGKETYKPRTPAGNAADRSAREIGHRLRHQSAATMVQVTTCRSPASTWVDAHAAARAAARPRQLATGSRSSRPRSCRVTALLIGFFVARPLINACSRRSACPACRCNRRTPAHGDSCRRQALRRPTASRQIGARRQPASIPAPHRSIDRHLAIEGQVRESSIRKVGEVVEAHPEEALAIIRTWLHQPA